MTLFFSLYTFCYPHTNFNKIHFRSEKKKKRTHHSISLRNTTLEDLWARSFLGPQTAMRSDLRPAERTGDGQPWALVPATMGDPVLPRVRGLTRNDRKALEERLPAASLRRDSAALTRDSPPQGMFCSFEKEEKEKLGLKNLHRK